MLGVAFLFGVMLVIPIGSADMPVVMSLLNSYAGLAAAATGFVLGNNVLIIAGTLDGFSGFILSVLMCKAMNRSITNVLFGGFGAVIAEATTETGGVMREISIDDAAMQLAFANRVVFVPGYGLATAQAQHAVRELAELLEDRGVTVKYAIHPVAGRMPGHMNVLLAEANVPYSSLYEMEQINPEFPSTDVAVVIGANDVVNPDARDNPKSLIAGMPILEVDRAKSVIVLKRGQGRGFSGLENPALLQVLHIDAVRRRKIEPQPPGPGRDARLAITPGKKSAARGLPLAAIGVNCNRIALCCTPRKNLYC